MERDDLTSDRAFALLLQHRSIPFVPEDRLEEAVVVLDGKRSDFCIKLGLPHVLAEVTEFDAPGPLDGALSPGGASIEAKRCSALLAFNWQRPANEMASSDFA